jgi:hypothetical protein
MIPGSQILANTTQYLARTQGKNAQLLVCDQHLYSVAPQALGIMRASFASWDFNKKYGTWRGTSGQGASRYTPHEQDVKLVRLLSRLPENPMDTLPELHDILDQTEPLGSYLTILDRNGRGPAYVNGLWRVPQSTLVRAMREAEAEEPAFMWKYELRTPFWKLTFPTEQGIRLERTGTAFETRLPKYAMPEPTDEQGKKQTPTPLQRLRYDITNTRSDADSQLETILRMGSDIEELQAVYETKLTEQPSAATRE